MVEFLEVKHGTNREHGRVHPMTSIRLRWFDSSPKPETRIVFKDGDGTWCVPLKAPHQSHCLCIVQTKIPAVNAIVCSFWRTITQFSSILRVARNTHLKGRPTRFSKSVLRDDAFAVDEAFRIQTFYLTKAEFRAAPCTQSRPPLSKSNVSA